MEEQKPFRSHVINGAQRKRESAREVIVFEIPVTRSAFDRRKESPMRNGVKN